MLTDGFHDLPPGKLAAVVTHLQMFERPPPRPVPPRPDLTLTHQPAPDVEWYRDLFRRVGGLEWVWASRLAMDVRELSKILQDPRVEVHALRQDAGRGPQDVGLLELDFREDGVCELAFFGVVPEAVGGGAGRLLMEAALSRVWSHPDHAIARFWVHTCSLDHPDALRFYIRSGFVPYLRQIEIGDDPRLTGVLPLTAGPRMPPLST